MSGRTHTFAFDAVPMPGSSLGAVFTRPASVDLTLHMGGEELQMHRVRFAPDGTVAGDIDPAEYARFSRELRLDQEAVERMSWEGGGA